MAEQPGMGAQPGADGRTAQPGPASDSQPQVAPSQPPAPRSADRIPPAVPAPPQLSAVPVSQPPTAPAQPVASGATGAQAVGGGVPHAAPGPANVGVAGGDGEKQHVHSSYIWLGGLRSIIVVIFALGVSFGSTIIGFIADGTIPESELGVMFFISAGMAVLVLVIALLTFLATWRSWKHLFYQVGPDEFDLYSGIFNKKQVHVPYQRIQSVDQRATLLQRLLGVCTVQIETAGGSSNKAVVVPYATKSQAEWLRRELFARKQLVLAGQAPGCRPGTQAVTGAPASAGADGNILDAPASIWDDLGGGVFGGAGVETGRVTYEYGLSNKELVLTALSNNTAFVVIVVGLVATVGQLIDDVIPLFFGSDEDVVDIVVTQGMNLFGDNLVAAGVGAVVVGALAIWLLSLVTTCLSYGGFKARRRDSRIEVERGLLQHQFSGVDVDRVQSVVVRQSLIRRLMGYCELSLGKVDSVVGDGEQGSSASQKGLVIHPFVKMSRVPEILAGIIPEFQGIPTEAIPVAPVALRRAILRRGLWQGAGFWTAVAGALLLAFSELIAWALADVPSDVAGGQFILLVIAGILLAVGVVLFVLEVVGAVLWARESSFAFNEGFMQVSNGGISRESVNFPRKKIQFGYTRTNPFQRRAHTATIVAVTAAGVGGTKVSLIDAREQHAQLWLDWVKPGGQGLCVAVEEPKG